jgi:hypothetical protein
MYTMYFTIHEHISRIAMCKFCGYSWYLASQIVALSFFHDVISLNTKRRMIEALKFMNAEDSVERVIILPENVKSYVDV